MFPSPCFSPLPIPCCLTPATLVWFLPSLLAHTCQVLLFTLPSQASALFPLHQSPHILLSGEKLQTVVKAEVAPSVGTAVYLQISWHHPSCLVCPGFFVVVFFLFILITNRIIRQVFFWKERAFWNLQLCHSYLVFKAVSTHLAAAQLPMSVLSSKILTVASNAQCVFVLYCTAVGKTLPKWVFRLVTCVPINLPAFIHILSLSRPF